ncbi:Mannose-1-phosphate guanylyltransferase / Mannose-6-phosphate isomerase [hydrothermal vent metagenome]|uniref:Mannose-1-phosphate guanylyltransferase / Mannose-6-phosphate isomerase n=1 Tax=hydrothermal vent metagenome TaxID=652676 RepID=A0A3B1CC30_9ZZZZ
MIFSVIMAGGKGTRFWPLSRENHPKQLLSIVGDTTMIQSTYERIKPLSGSDRVIVITGSAHADEIKKQLPEIPPENIVAEPVGRNTAPCVALAAMIAQKQDPNAVLGVYPADHVITNEEVFRNTAQVLINALKSDSKKLGTMGIVPTYPETGFGYIHRSAKTLNNVYTAKEFCEKPDIGTAKRYMESGEYYWNAGVFFWRADTILNEIKNNLPELWEKMKPIDNAIGSPDFADVMNEIYPDLPSISIDYGVMEKAGKAGNVLVAPADPGWSDVGSWRSLYDLVPADDAGNRQRGKVITVNSHGTLVYNEKRLVALVGVDDVIVVETDDAILVLNKNQAQNVREVTEKLKEQGLTGYL